MGIATKMSLKFSCARAIVAASVFMSGAVLAADLDFSNPAVAQSVKPVIDSGACIAKYTVALNNASQSVAAVAQQVAKRCDKEISLSAGVASLLAGKPEDFSKNLKYAQEELTARSVERYRANTQMVQMARN